MSKSDVFQKTLTLSPNKFILRIPNTGMQRNAVFELILCPPGSER